MTTPDLWFLNSRIVIRRASADGPDGVSILEHFMPQGDSPPTHVHHDEDEIFHILEGRLRFRLHDSELVAGPGQTIVAPKGAPHTFIVESPSARVLTLQTGSAFEGAVRAVSRPATTAGLPAPTAPTAEMARALEEVFGRFGIDFVGPPMAA